MHRVNQFAYKNFVYAVAFSTSTPPFLAVGLGDRSVVLCDADSGGVLHTLKGHTNLVSSLSFSPCNQLLASGSFDNSVILWDVHSEEKQCIKILKPERMSIVLSVAFSPNGKLLAEAGCANAIIVWNMPEAVAGLHLELEGHTSYVNHVAFSPDGLMLASASDDFTVRLWHMPEGTAGAVLSTSATARSVAFSPIIKNQLAVGTYDSIQLHNLDNRSNKQIVPSYVGQKLIFSPDGKQIISSHPHNGIVSWKAKDEKGTLKRMFDREESGQDLAFHPNGHQIASFLDYRVCIWTVCEWSDRLHYLFGPELKRLIFQLMCVKLRIERRTTTRRRGMRLPMEIWLNVFQMLAATVCD